MLKIIGTFLINLIIITKVATRKIVHVFDILDIRYQDTINIKML